MNKQPALTAMSDSELAVVTDKLLQKIKCKQCSSPLSVPPIRLIGEDSVCGRCPGDGLRMKPLEALAKQFQYPCRNHKEGCNLLLTCDKITKHEKSCGFEKIECIYKTDSCEWIGLRNNLKTHFASNHLNWLISRKGTFINIKTLSVGLNRFLYAVDDAVFKVEVNNTESQIIFKFIKILSKADAYAYKIIFFNKDTTLAYLRVRSFISTVDLVILKSVFNSFYKLQMEIVVNTAEKMSIFDKNLSRLECPVVVVD